MVELCPYDSHFVELGGFKGKSTSYMAVEIINSGKNIRFDCVDLFVDCPQGLGEEIKRIFLDNISSVRGYVNPVIANSSEAAGLFNDNSIDFVFVDASHEYHGVKADLIAWSSKLKENGVLAGHDIGWEGVKRAVAEVLPMANIIDEYCYCVRKIGGYLVGYNPLI